MCAQTFANYFCICCCFSEAFSFFFPFSGNQLQTLRLFCSFLIFWKNAQWWETTVLWGFFTKTLKNNCPRWKVCTVLLHLQTSVWACVSITAIDRKTILHTCERGRERVAEHHRLYSLLCFLENFSEGCHWSSSGKWIKCNDSFHTACLPARSCLFQSL